MSGYPWEKPTDQAMGAHVREAASVIEKHGWIQKDYGEEEIGFCVLGAMSRVRNSWVNIFTTHAFAEFLPEVEIGKTADGEPLIAHNIAYWNDVPDRTKEEVLQYMHKFADELDPLPPAELKD